MDTCFPKRQRLRKRSDFLLVQQQGAALRRRYFVVVSSPGRGRLGITVSKKVGNAVTRNRVKRLVREFVRRARPGAMNSWEGPPWLPEDRDVVVIAKTSARDASFAAISADLSAMAAELRALSGRAEETTC